MQIWWKNGVGENTHTQKKKKKKKERKRNNVAKRSIDTGIT